MNNFNSAYRLVAGGSGTEGTAFAGMLVASGITAGCGSGNYCPDAPLTQGQMAVFLAKALGLQWPP